MTLMCHIQYFTHIIKKKLYYKATAQHTCIIRIGCTYYLLEYLTYYIKKNTDNSEISILKLTCLHTLTAIFRN